VNEYRKVRVIRAGKWKLENRNWRRGSGEAL
jgi:hypothetical protein